MSMPECIHHYYRNDNELSYEEWINLFHIDLDIENENSTWDIRGAVWADYGNGRDIELNGHMYKCRIDWVYDTAKELLDDMIDNGEDYELVNAIKSLSEEEATMFIKYIDRAKSNEQKFILEDNKDY